MQDNGLKKVAAALIELAGTDDVYKVVEADEVLEKLPAGESMDKQALGEAIRDLKNLGYLEVKYFTPDEYCLLVSPRAEELIAPPAAQTPTAPAAAPDAVLPAALPRTSARRERGAKRVGAGIFLAAFAGGMLGGAIVAMIAILLQKFAL